MLMNLKSLEVHPGSCSTIDSLMTFLADEITTSHACPVWNYQRKQKKKTLAKGIQEFDSVRGRRGAFLCGDGVIDNIGLAN